MRSIWITAVGLVLASAALAEEEDGRLARPIPTADQLAFPVSGAALSIEKDGKALTGRLAGTIGEKDEIAWEIGLAGADVDQTTQRSTVLHSFPKAAGGTVDVAATWTIGFSVLKEKASLEAIEAVCEARPKVPPVKVDELAKVLEEQAKAKSTAEAVRQLASELKGKESAAAQAVDDALRSGEPEDTVAKLRKEAEAASTAAAQAEATLQAANAQLDEKEKQVPALLTRHVGTCVLSQLSAEEQAEVFRRAGALPPFYIVKAHAKLGAQLFKYWDETTGADTKATEHPAEFGVLAGVQLRPTMLLGAGVSRAWTWESGTAGSICENQTVGGETTTPPTQKCHDIALSGPTPSVSWKARVEWSQYFTKTIAITPNLQGTFKRGFLARPSSIAGEFPVFWRLPVGEEKDGKWLVLGASAAATYDVTKEELTPGVNLFLAASFPKF